ncbi:MAG: hypothetical protein ABIK92_08990 [Pseudomonadota bacterium]
MTTYNTIEAVVKEGVIYPLDPKKLPREGKLLLIVLDEKNIQPDIEKIRNLLGWLKTDADSVKWQQQIRSEWDKRLCDI